MAGFTCAVFCVHFLDIKEINCNRISSVEIFLIIPVADVYFSFKGWYGIIYSLLCPYEELYIVEK